MRMWSGRSLIYVLQPFLAVDVDNASAGQLADLPALSLQGNVRVEHDTLKAVVLDANTSAARPRHRLLQRRCFGFGLGAGKGLRNASVFCLVLSKAGLNGISARIIPLSRQFFYLLLEGGDFGVFSSNLTA